jgi:hypothetical protein
MLSQSFDPPPQWARLQHLHTSPREDCQKHQCEQTARAFVGKLAMQCMLFILDVKSNGTKLHQLEVSFGLDREAIEHSRDLAARLRQRHFPASAT